MIEEAEVSAQVVRGQHLQSNDRPRVALMNSQELHWKLRACRVLGQFSWSRYNQSVDASLA